jgi:acetyl esterase
MPLDPQFRAILDSLDSAGALPLVRTAPGSTSSTSRPVGLPRPRLTWPTADARGVAPAVVATAEFDPLRDEGAAYADRLGDAGVPIEYVPGPGLIHGFAGFFGVVDAAGAAVETILTALRRILCG